MPRTTLTHRALLKIGGSDASEFLQRIVTADLNALAPAAATPCALLSPQGKVLHEFLLSGSETGFIIDVSRAFLPDLARRLMLFRLHADVTFEPLPGSRVLAIWNEDGGLRDLRFPEHTARLYDDESEDTASLEEWTRHRILAGVLEVGTDYRGDDLFPHDVSLIENGGVSVGKGCFVGQEVVSRMHHRGTGRRRAAIVRGSTSLPPPGTAIVADNRPLGTLGSSIDDLGLAIVRIDRLTVATTASLPVFAAATELKFDVPPGASWTLEAEDAVQA